MSSSPRTRSRSLSLSLGISTDRKDPRRPRASRGAIRSRQEDGATARYLLPPSPRSSDVAEFVQYLNHPSLNSISQAQQINLTQDFDRRNADVRCRDNRETRAVLLEPALPLGASVKQSSHHQRHSARKQKGPARASSFSGGGASPARTMLCGTLPQYPDRCSAQDSGITNLHIAPRRVHTYVLDIHLFSGGKT
jgi:hypothetical protein